MNPRPFLLLPVLGLLANCNSLNEPVYYNENGQQVSVNALGQPPIASSRQAQAAAPAVADIPQYSTASSSIPTPASSPTPRVRSQRTSNSPFMQPDVLGLPSKDDLKETSSSTPSNSGTSGLTVPSR